MIICLRFWGNWEETWGLEIREVVINCNVLLINELWEKKDT